MTYVDPRRAAWLEHVDTMLMIFNFFYENCRHKFSLLNKFKYSLYAKSSTFCTTETNHFWFEFEKLFNENIQVPFLHSSGRCFCAGFREKSSSTNSNAKIQHPTSIYKRLDWCERWSYFKQTWPSRQNERCISTNFRCSDWCIWKMWILWPQCQSR